METKSLKSFIYLEDGHVDCSILDVIKVSKELAAGFYNLKAVREDYRYVPRLEVGELPEHKNKCIEFKELKEFNKYLKTFKKEDKKQAINALGYKHKIGAILHGKQGTGKTVVTSCMAKDLIEEGGIAINIDTSIIDGMPCLLDFLKDLRKVNTKRFLFIFDESEVVLKELEGTFKNFLDGYNSINNSISVFTTNYIDKIPKTIYERPSRIRFSVELEGMSREEDIVNMVESSLNRKPSQEEIKKLMNKTADEIKEFIINDIFEYKEDKKETKGLGFRS